MPITRQVRKLQTDNRHRSLEQYPKHEASLPEDLAGRISFDGAVVFCDGTRLGSLSRSGAATRATMPDGRTARKVSVVAAIRWMLENR